MTLALLDARTQGVGAQLNLRDDGTMETLVTCRHGSTLLAHGALLTPAQTRELWHQLGAALLHPDRGQWRPCPTWDNGCKCSPLFSCQRDPVAPSTALHAATSPSSPPGMHAPAGPPRGVPLPDEWNPFAPGPDQDDELQGVAQ